MATSYFAVVRNQAAKKKISLKETHLTNHEPEKGRAPRGSVPTLISFFGPAPNYLNFSLRSAADFNKQVVMLGDATNRGFWKEHWDSSQNRLLKWEEFKRSYTKMSDYPESYEIGFWRRPFAVEEWMRSEGVDQAFSLESDLVTFADYSKVVLPVLPSGCAAAVCTPHEQDNFFWSSSLHFSYWTLDGLTDFTSFCIEAYRDAGIRRKLEAKYRWHVENRQPGGICEMTLLYLWCKRNETKTWNLAKVWDGMVGDLAITTSDNYFNGEYEMRRGFKKFIFKKGVPYGYNKMLGKDIRFLCIHCQSYSKWLMKFLSTRRWQKFYADAYYLRQVAIPYAKAKARSSLKAVLGPLLSGKQRHTRD